MAEVDLFKFYRPALANYRNRPFIPDLYRGPQYFVSRDDEIECALQRRDVEVSFQANGLGLVIDGRVGDQLFQEPEPFLGWTERTWHAFDRAAELRRTSAGNLTDWRRIFVPLR